MSAPLASGTSMPSTTRAERLGRWWSVFARNKPAVLGLCILTVIVGACALGPLVFTTDPAAQDLVLRKQTPSADAWFGRDEFGRDLFVRVLHGGRATLVAALGAVTLSAAIGSTLGIIAGYFGRWRDSLIMRGMDLMLSFPYFLLALLIVAVAGPGLRNAAVAVAIAYIPQFARVTRSAAAEIRHREFIDSARVSRVSDSRILVGHVLPNVSAPILVLGTVGMAMAITGVASLSFLGLGAQPPQAEWGAMLASSREQLFSTPHMALFPGVAIVLTVLSLNLVGDGLRDAFDPKSQ